MISYGQVKADTLKLLDEYSSRGAVQSASKIADYNLKIQSLTNATIYSLASTTAKISAVFQIAHNPIKNTPSDDTSAIQTHVPGDDYSITLINAKSCFFETTGPATIVLEESADNGVTYASIETIVIASTVTTFNEYRRLISPSIPTNTVRLRFSGDFPYSFRNFVLYPYTFADEASVQQHRPVFEIPLPSDFYTINEVFIKTRGQNIPHSDYFITPDKRYCFNAYVDTPAEFIINYWRRPTLLTFTGVDATDDAQVIDLTDEAALIIPWSVAGDILKSEQLIAQGAFCLNQFEAKRGALITNRTEYSSTIRNVTDW